MATSFATLHAIADVRQQVRAWKQAGQRVALVPTMGNLHEGHLSLVRLAKQRADRVVVSVFVNPTQFGPNEDFASYPRTLTADQILLQEGGCDVLFAPTAAEMYPQAPSLTVDVGTIGTILCGAIRPGHFNGVAGVVAKLFLIAEPDLAVFGEKDFQQLLVIRKLVRELNFAVEIVGAPTIREANGLARSSRNQYLSADERALARVIYATLLQMRDMRAAQQSLDVVQSYALSALEGAGLKPDYAVIRDAESLELIEKESQVARNAVDKQESKSEVALIAARLGKARLIDNLSWVC
jgi:pantoate--beta-alanine ligase